MVSKPQRLTLLSVEALCAKHDMVVTKRVRKFYDETYRYELYDNKLFTGEDCHDLAHVMQARDSFLQQRKENLQ